MIIEDDKVMSSIYRRIIEQNNHSVVIVAASVKEARSQFKLAQSMASEHPQPEILIADNRLPDGLGIELSKEFTQINPKLKVILATADAYVTDDMAKEAGILQVLRKPFALDSLLLAISYASETLMKDEKSSKSIVTQSKVLTRQACTLE